MNYRHAFHAGNHADVFKHLTLTRLIALMSVSYIHLTLPTNREV